MGLDSKVFKFASEKYFFDFRGRGWLFQGLDGYRMLPKIDPNKPLLDKDNPSIEHMYEETHKHRRRVVLIDAPTMLYSTKSFRNYSFEAKTFGDITKIIAEKINYHLTHSDNVDVEGVIFLFDKSSPAAKACKKRHDEKTPETPFHILEHLDVSTLDKTTQGIRAWETFCYASTMTNMPEHKSNIPNQLPYSIASKLRLPSYRAKNRDVKYIDCLSNKHFKRMMYSYVCEGLANELKPSNGKWVIIGGPNYYVFLDHEGQKPVPAGLDFQYEEVDFCVGYWASHLCTQYNVDIESDDGDSVLSLLESTDQRIYILKEILSNPSHIPPEKELFPMMFYNCVRIIRNRWRKSPGSVIDINRMYGSIYKTIIALCKTDNCDIRLVNPIGIFALLARVGGGSDYLNEKTLYRVGPATVFKCFFQNFKLLSEGMISDHVTRPEIVTINHEKFALFVMLLWQSALPQHLKLRLTDIHTFVDVLNQRTRAMNEFPIIDVRDIVTYFANLCWVTTYSVTSSYRDISYPHEFEGSHNGGSAYGFVRESTEKHGYEEGNEFGHHEVSFAKNTNISFLVAKHNDWLRTIISTR